MDILKKPVITEKYTMLGEKLNKFAFRVSPTATKEEIKAAIETLYGVNVIAVNTMIYPGKAKSRYTKRGYVSGKTTRYKKAIVTLKDGDKIDFYGTV